MYAWISGQLLSAALTYFLPFGVDPSGCKRDSISRIREHEPGSLTGGKVGFGLKKQINLLFSDRIIKKTQKNGQLDALTPAGKVVN